MKIFNESLEFEWDEGNKGKNLIRHCVSDMECEEIFFDTNKKILKDILHSEKEERYILIGQTKNQRLLFIIFTIRKNKIRIISGRDLNKTEKKLYNEKS